MIEALIKYMENIPAGKIGDVATLERLLFECWHEFEGDAECLAGYKLLHRMEDVEWNPPKIHFSMERHGATVLGSTRAELQRWTVDLKTGVAEYKQTGKRQVWPQQPRLNVRPIADEITTQIVNHRNDDRLKWYDDGRVRVIIGKIIPDTGPKQTVDGRRKRFRKALEEQMEKHGWEVLRPNVYMQR